MDIERFRIMELKPTTAKLKKNRMMCTTSAAIIDFLSLRPSAVLAVLALDGYQEKKSLLRKLHILI